MIELPYCGAPPLPGELLTRFNTDPVLIGALIVMVSLQWWATRHLPAHLRLRGLLGWLIAAAALISPLCALSVALFAARIAQHMILILVAAPLIAVALPAQAPRPVWMLWFSALAFFCALWFWHMPMPYEATFQSTAIYWCMHISLSVVPPHFGTPFCTIGALTLWTRWLPARSLPYRWDCWVHSSRSLTIPCSAGTC